MHRRQTLAADVELVGVGLHTGARRHIRLTPAAEGTGVRFIRSDLGGIAIPACLACVGPSYYATVLECEGARVSTIEHLMAAIWALRVDDIAIEIDGPEVPILDGSSAPFVEAILAAGRIEQAAFRQYMTLVRPVVVEAEGKRIAAYPCPEFRVTYAIDFDHPKLGYQELTASLWDEREFVDKVAPARTFTLEREVEALRSKGLALGGSLENAVVVGDEGPLNATLRFADEFVRHKMLDLLGDLSLLGHPLRAHVVAYRAGHDLHSRLAHRIAAAREAWYLAPWSEQSTGPEAAATA